MNDKENSEPSSNEGSFPDLDNFMDSQDKLNELYESSGGDKREEAEEINERGEDQETEVRLRKAKTDTFMQIRTPSGEFNTEEFGRYSSVRESPSDIQLFEFPSTVQNTRKNSIKSDYGFSSSYFEGDLNYLAVKEDITQRRRLMDEIEIKVGNPEKKKGDNYLYFHAYKISILQNGKEIWRLYRR